MIIASQIKVLLMWVGFKNTFCLFAELYLWFTCLGIRHTYELRRCDGGPKYEKWLKSHEILYWVTFKIAKYFDTWSY